VSNRTDTTLSGDGRDSPNKLGWAAVLTGWPSPTALSFNESHQPGNNRSMNKTMELAGWPTAGATDHKGPSQPEGRRPVCDNDLPSTALLTGWRTPNTTDADHGGPNARDSNGSPHLAGQAALPGWTTPQHRDHKGIDQKACKGEINNSLPNQVAGLTASPSPAGTESRAGSVLNPAMSRWLMGFPQNGATPGWDTCSPGWQNWALIQMLLGEYYETQRGTASAPCEAQATP